MEVRQKCISPGRSRNVSEVWSRGGAWSLGAMLGRLWLPCGQDQEQASASLTFRNCFDWQAERNPSEWMCSCCSVVAAIRAWLCCCSSRSRAEWAQGAVLESTLAPSFCARVGRGPGSMEGACVVPASRPVPSDRLGEGGWWTWCMHG